MTNGKTAAAVGLAAVVGLMSYAAFANSSSKSIDATAVDETAVDETTRQGSTTLHPTSLGSRPAASTCAPVDPPESLEASFEQLVVAYNNHDPAAVVSVIGDGTVADPSLELGRLDPYPSVETWIAAANNAGDRIEVQGYGAGNPFRLFASRENDQLRSAGIDRLSFTLEISASPGCGQRLQTLDEISVPDACAYHRLADPSDTATGCSDTFEPRMGHVSLLADDELLIFGGATGTSDAPPLVTGLAYSPETGWRDLAPAPVGLSYWPATPADWTGDRMVVVGNSQPDVVVLSYFPGDDRWEISPPLPEQRYGPGAVASTGTEIIIVGGSQNDPRDTAWSYQLDTRQWRQLPSPDILPVENKAGVWTGTEAVFFGGYPSTTYSPGVAYNPTTGRWRTLPPAPAAQLVGNELIWTGAEVISVGGHSGPGHLTRLSIYNPSTDTWRESAALPISAVENLAADWTGTELILWGGFGSYSNGVSADGARYNPSTDTWTVTARSTLTPRCGHSGTWTPNGFVVLGGLEICGDPGVLARGNAAVYDPTSDAWTELFR